MPIRVLDSSIAEKIAAGEVVERPASVVKELTENALDAGANEIQVVLEDGGKVLIEVSDNGSGMSASDLELAVLRHATSKLSTLEDLENIRTLGFRGEALPSIAAVAELSVLSRPKAEDGGADAHEWKDGRVQAATFGHFLGSPHGTRVQVRGLFAQVPARLKFLKSAASEITHVRDWIERLSLTHPHVGFRLVHNDRTVIHLRGQPTDQRVRAVLAGGEDYPIVTIERGSERSTAIPSGLKATAYWLQGLSLPSSKRLVQVVNGRVLKDRLLQQAIVSAFRQALLPGQYPALALYLDVPPSELDVNVHPTKTEVRFLNGSQIFRLIQGALEDLIARDGAPVRVAGVPQASAPLQWSLPPTTPVGAWGASEPTPTFSPGPASLASSGMEGPALNDGPSTGIAPSPLNPLAHAKQVGTLFQTYALFDLGNELALLDQHAAHERIRYEKLRSRWLDGQAGGSQALLIPEAVSFDSEQRGEIERKLEVLSRAGFEAELFGENTLLFRTVPAEWGADHLRVRLKGLVERLLSLEPRDNASAEARIELDEVVFEKLASEACHSSVRAGDRLQSTEVDGLVDALFRCEHPWNCPHGRPTLVRIPRARFEEWFQRIV